MQLLYFTNSVNRLVFAMEKPFVVWEEGSEILFTLTSDFKGWRWIRFLTAMLACHFARLCKKYNCGYGEFVSFFVQVQSLLVTFLWVIFIIFAEYNQEDVMFLNLFISVRRCTCFRRVFPSIIRSTKLYIQCQVFVRPLLLPDTSYWLYSANILAMHGPMNVKFSKYFFTWFLWGYAVAYCRCATGFVGIEYYILIVTVFVVCGIALIFYLVDFVT